MTKLLLLLLLISASSEAQLVQIPPDNCSTLLQTDLNRMPVTDHVYPGGKHRKSVDLKDAVAFVTNSISAANCHTPHLPPKFALNTADLDFQTLTDNDGSLEILAIGGIVLGIDKQITTDSDFTYSVPTPSNARSSLFASRKPKQPLADAIYAAVTQMTSNLGAFASLSQHQVKVSIKFAVTKDGTLEAEPSFGILGITSKFTRTTTETQTLTLTFSDMVPSVALSLDPATIAVNLGQTTAQVSLVAAVTPPNYSTLIPTGKVRFSYDVGKTVDAILNGGIAIAPVELNVGNHIIMATYLGDQDYDAAASTPSLVVVK